MPRTNKSYDQGFRDGYKRAVEDYNARQVQPATDLDTFALEEAARILAQQLGYIRLGLGADRRYWTRYKWTRGPLEGFYTLASGDTIGASLATTIAHADEVEAGKRKPTRDNPPRKYPPKG